MEFIFISLKKVDRHFVHYMHLALNIEKKYSRDIIVNYMHHLMLNNNPN